jgi:HEAT repeat protein
MEPVWGGQSDSAPTLRGACALALINCQLDDLSLLAQLTHGLADPAKPVRIDTAVAIAQLGRTEGALLLRLKTLLGDTEPEVLGQCFSSLLSLSPRESVQFIGEFLKAPSEDIQQEAAGALAQSGQTEAIEHLTRFWEERLSPEMRRALLIHFASSPMPELSEFVLSVVENERSELSAHALAALATSRHRTNLAGRISAVVNERRDPNLRRIFEREFGSQG